MKKFVGTIAAAALIASAAFADVGIGSWGRGVFAPLQGSSDAEGVTSWEGVSWGGNTVRTGISIHGESENIGFNIDMNADGNAAGIGDTAYFWAKPWEMVEFKMGKVQDDTGRGNVAYGLFNWKRIGGGWTGEDVTFTRFGNGNGGQANGFIAKVTPIDGLWAIACLDVQDNKKAELTYGNHAQYGVGYDIDGIGSVRAQYIGGENTTDWDGSTVPADKINAAFDLTAVENLYVTVGAYVPLHLNRGNVTATPASGDTPASMSSDLAQVKVAAGAQFNVSIVTLHALFVANLPNTYDKNNVKATKDFDCLIGVGADFDLGNGIALNADVRYQTAQTASIEVANTKTTYTLAGDDVSFLVGLTKGLANGYVGIGFEGELASSPKADFTGKKDAVWSWNIPVVVSAWF